MGRGVHRLSDGVHVRRWLGLEHGSRLSVSEQQDALIGSLAHEHSVLGKTIDQPALFVEDNRIVASQNRAEEIRIRLKCLQLLCG